MTESKSAQSPVGSVGMAGGLNSLALAEGDELNPEYSVGKSEPQRTWPSNDRQPPDIGHLLCDKATLFEVDHTYDHRPPRIKGNVLKAPSPVELADLLIDRMGEHAKAPDLVGSPQCRRQCEKKKRARMALALIGLVDGQLPQQRRRHRIGLVASVGLGKEFALDLRGAQRHVADDQPRAGVTDYACARDAGHVIFPRMASEPPIEGVAPTIEMAALVVFCKRAWRRYLRHVGGLRASSLSPAISRAGFAAHASNRSQSLAGIATIRRSSTSTSAASSALRRTKSLTLVRACADAVSNNARSSSLNRTLSTDDGMTESSVLRCMTLTYMDRNVNGFNS